MRKFARLDFRGKEHNSLTHPHDIKKPSGNTILAIGMVYGEDNGYTSIDFGKGPIRFLSSRVIPVSGVTHAVGEKVLAKGKEAEIVRITWNASKEYYYYTIKKNGKESTGWYLESDIADLPDL